ncbi:MAG: glycosyltransferase [Clostridia bacterium]|nr:glycosyltransferase [Clostridia bacterium]
MKVLLLLSESWNDQIYPNNNMSNWFTGFPDLEIATIQCGPEKPSNHCCKNYFCVSDLEMAKSIFPGKRAGRVLRYEEYPSTEAVAYSSVETAVYARKSHLHNGFVRLLRSVIWCFGRYHVKLLKSFIEDFSPDIVFSQRMGSVKMCRLEAVVQKLCKAPMIAYTGDNEYLQDGLTGGFFDRLHAVWTRKWLDKMIPTYSLYYSMSDEQMRFYESKFGVEMKFLVKCGAFSEELVHKKVHSPIRLVYAEKLYWGRGDTLSLIAQVLRRINTAERPIQLDIYTGDTLTPDQKTALDDGVVSTVHCAVPSEALPAIYGDADLVLHVEGFDRSNAIKTKYSFSTKIMDCLSSGCAVLAVCDPSQAGFLYLQQNDIAITASSEEELRERLEQMLQHPEIIPDYAKKAYEFGVRFHQREKVQQMLYNDFMKVLYESH